MKRLDRGVRESSESPPTPPSPPAYATTTTVENKNTKLHDSVSTSSLSSNVEKSRRKRRSGSRSSSTRSSHKRSKSRDRQKDRSSRKHSRRDRSKSRSRSRERRRSRSRNKSRDHHRSHRDNNKRHRQASWESDANREEFHESLGGGGGEGGGGGRNNYQNQLNFIIAQQQQQQQSNAFKNDGSFMEMFKKMQEQMPNASLTQGNPSACGLGTVTGISTAPTPSTHVLQEKPAPPPPLMVGKRRGGRILKTGMVAKPKSEPTADQPKDAWSLYMAEVKKYREVCCQEEDNTRPLVK